MRLILLLKVFQSIEERAPVVVEDARVIPNCVPDKISPFDSERLRALEMLVSITSPCAFTERNFPFHVFGVFADVRLVNRRPPVPESHELISNFELGVAVPIQTFPILVIRNLSVKVFHAAPGFLVPILKCDE